MHPDVYSEQRPGKHDSWVIFAKTCKLTSFTYLRFCIGVWWILLHMFVVDIKMGHFEPCPVKGRGSWEFHWGNRWVEGLYFQLYSSCVDLYQWPTGGRRALVPISPTQGNVNVSTRAVTKSGFHYNIIFKTYVINKSWQCIFTLTHLFLLVTTYNHPKCRIIRWDDNVQTI